MEKIAKCSERAERAEHSAHTERAKHAPHAERLEDTERTERTEYIGHAAHTKRAGHTELTEHAERSECAAHAEPTEHTTVSVVHAERAKHTPHPKHPEDTEYTERAERPAHTHRNNVPHNNTPRDDAPHNEVPHNDAHRNDTPRNDANHVTQYLDCRDRKKSKLCAQINAYLEYCAVTRQMSKWTIYGKIATYRNLVAETTCKSLEQLTNAEFDQFIKAEIERGLAPSSVNQKSANVVAMVRHWKEMGLSIPLKIPVIVKLKEHPTRRVFYTREEIRKVLRRCNSDLQWLLIKIAFDTGMRITELTNLSLQQINGQRINFIGKGSKAREVYICEDTRARLTAYIERNRITGRIWLNEWGFPMAASTIRRIMREVFVRCGYRDFHPHALRHSFGSDIQRRGADIMVIKEMMGHSSVATTQRYLHGFEGQLEELFKRYKG